MEELGPPQPTTYSTAVGLARVNVWQPETRSFHVLRPRPGEPWPSEAGAEVLEAAAEQGAPVWVELELTSGWPDWYGSWEEFDRPVVSWEGVRPLFRGLGLGTPAEVGTATGGDLTLEALRVLPFIYELGATRAFGEIEAAAEEKRSVRSFAAVGFEVRTRTASGERHVFEPVRLNIASVGRFVFTVPQRSLSRDEVRLELPVKTAICGPPRLQVPIRYLPVNRSVTANDVVDGIALYLGAACEWVVDAVESNLTTVESAFFKEVGEKDANDLARADVAKRLEEAFEVLQQLGRDMRTVGRELARILQRSPAGAVGSGGGEATARVALRYEEALKKVDALQMQLRLVGETMASALTTQQFVIAEQHRRLDEERRTEGEHLQRGGTLLAALILVPSLMAAIYGANVPVPGSEDAQGVLAMLLFMLGGGLLTWTVITSITERSRHKTGTPPAWYESKRLRMASGTALASFLLGVVIVLVGDPGGSNKALRVEDAGFLVASVVAVLGLGAIARRERSRVLFARLADLWPFAASQRRSAAS